jgi:hypothetical protein
VWTRKTETKPSQPTLRVHPLRKQSHDIHLHLGITREPVSLLKFLDIYPVSRLFGDVLTHWIGKATPFIVFISLV